MIAVNTLDGEDLMVCVTISLCYSGRITLVMCKEFKQAKEEADEVAELDCSNIISTGEKTVTCRTFTRKLEEQFLHA